ncbi:kinesin-like protein KIN-5A [Iris pallida]|uniref:Kinesin-like protein KIN-5A n=1 Tax=Iris pallida TaxID=29817 RepID=A0AAX6ERU4_IRIPA|nr:kinesin-like protein KIN-5A [Iris pallida]KAJ6806794.1 kinesin-like protein KIN-5A [Iris pallida]
MTNLKGVALGLVRVTKETFAGYNFCGFLSFFMENFSRRGGCPKLSNNGSKDDKDRGVVNIHVILQCRHLNGDVIAGRRWEFLATRARVRCLRSEPCSQAN